MFEMDCFVSSDDLQMLINRMDKGRRGKITFKEVRITYNREVQFEAELTAKSPFNY